MRYLTIKRAADRLPDRTGTPSNICLICLHYVWSLLNHSRNEIIQGVPFNQLNDVTVDISAF